MAEQPAEMTHELLRQIRSEQAAFRSEHAAFRSEVERRFDALETDVVEIKRTLRGLTYLMATATGRLEEVEPRVDPHDALRGLLC